MKLRTLMSVLAGIAILMFAASHIGSQIKRKPITPDNDGISVQLVQFTTTEPNVHVKDTPEPEVIHNSVNVPTTTKPAVSPPYQALCDFAGSHPDSAAFIENLFTFGYEHADSQTEYYEYWRPVVLTIMNREVLCEDPYDQAIIEGSYPFMFAESDT